jgi:hypothetical protein
MGATTFEELQKATYLDITNLGERTVKLMALWDGLDWHMWLETPIGLIKSKVVDTTEGDYVAKTAAKNTDLFIPFVHIMWQHASWGDLCPLILAISDDFHNMGTSVAKLRHSFDFRSKRRRAGLKVCVSAISSTNRRLKIDVDHS